VTLKSNWEIHLWAIELHQRLACYVPHVYQTLYQRSDHFVEIGPGRGAWTKTMLDSKEVYALDALPEKHNRFYEYLDHPRNVQYHQVEDFDCRILPDNYLLTCSHLDVLCHVSFEGITRYAVNILPKLTSGSNCF